MQGRRSRKIRAEERPPSEPGTEDLTLLPVQFTTPARSKLNGVHQLMAAVLADGVESFCKTLGAASRYEQRIHSESAEWIFSDDRSGLFSFLNLCEALDVDPDAVRDGLRKWGEGQRGRRAAANPGPGGIARLLARG